MEQVSWSRKHYISLTKAQHQLNDDWFKEMLSLLTNTGILVVPNLQKYFNKKGEEIWI